MSFHSKQSGNAAVHPATYVGTSDPASPDSTVTADNKLWIDTTTGTTFDTGWLLKIRATSNTVWTTILDLVTTMAKQAEVFLVAISDETTALTAGTAKATFRMPFACSMTLIPRANVNTVSSSGIPTFDIKKNGTTIFSTTLTIDVNEKTSVTAAVPAVLTSSPTTFADDDEITIDIVTAGTGTKGAKIAFRVVRT